MASYYTDRPRRALRSGLVQHDNANGVTLTRPIPLWLLRIAWVTLPLTAGPAAAAALRDWSDGPRLVGGDLLWARVGSWVYSRPSRRDRSRSPHSERSRLRSSCSRSSPRSVASHRRSRNGRRRWSRRRSRPARVGTRHRDRGGERIAYGDELRVPLRVPPALFLAPLPLARGLVVVGVAAGPLLLADDRIVLGVVALVVGLPVVLVLARALAPSLAPVGGARAGRVRGGRPDDAGRPRAVRARGIARHAGSRRHACRRRRTSSTCVSAPRRARCR